MLTFARSSLIAAREKKSKVDKPDFINAIDRILPDRT